jgi:mannan endo-1,4-beta-mannosidase
MNLRRHLVGRLVPLMAATLVVLSTAGVAAMARPAAAATESPAAKTAGTANDYVSREGSELTLGGAPWKFAGYNLSCQQPFLMTTAQLEYYFDDVKDNSGGNVVRMWWFQSDMGTGSDPWAPFETIVAAAKATGMRIIPTLTNQWNTCDEPSPATGEKELAWYQGGYTQPEGGYALSFKTFATEMATHFADTPTIAFWQLVNEAEDPSPTGCDEPVAAAALRSFADDMATSLHAVDPNHLVNLGTQGMGECGTEGSDYAYVQAGAVDLCEIHDYTNPAVALDPQVAADIAACAQLGKPTFVGESGIPANVQPDGSSGSAPITTATLNQRAAFFKAKIDAGNAAGLSGYVIWFKSPYYTPQLNSYAIGEGDPTQSVLADALLPSTAPLGGGADPPATIPEFPVAPEAPLAMVAVIVAALGVRRLRSRPD